MIKKILRFFKNVRQEMAFVSWPSKNDLKEGTTVVIVMSAVVAIFLSVVDWLFGTIVRFLLIKG
ncbi:MAG: preprotein translocase subunit SecE [Candidatus Cloacimonetes bacterium]|nr:preprotein translocase subunit SecE [Candidatus Cloacimonadota bacterium]